jgi:hypothetical protein
VSSAIEGRSEVGDYYGKRMRGNRDLELKNRQHQHFLNEMKRMYTMLHKAYWTKAAMKDQAKRARAAEASAKARDELERKMIGNFVEENSLLKDDTIIDSLHHTREFHVSPCYKRVENDD